MRQKGCAPSTIHTERIPSRDSNHKAVELKPHCRKLKGLEASLAGIAMETRMNTKNGVAYLDPTMLPRVFKDVEPQAESNPEHMDFSIRDRTLHGTRQIAHGLNQLEAANPSQPSWISSSFPSAILSVKTDARCSCHTDPPLPCIFHPS